MKGGYICILLLLMLPLVVALQDDATHPGIDEYNTNYYYSDEANGYTHTQQNIELKDHLGATLQWERESRPVICNADDTITGNEIYLLAQDRLYVYDASGTNIKNINWPAPQTQLACYDVDNDGLGDVMGILTSLGTPIYRIYGKESATIGIKSENSLTGLGSVPYSPITCVGAEDTATGEAVCAFTTFTRLQAYEYDTGAGNMATVSSTPLGSFATYEGTPISFINVADDLQANPVGFDYYLLFGHDDIYYRYSLSTANSSVFNKQTLNFNSRPLLDLKPLVNNQKVSPTTAGAQFYGNTSAVIATADNQNGDINVTLVQYHPSLTVLDNDLISGVDRPHLHNPTPHIRIGLWDYDEDGFQDVAIPYILRTGAQPTATISLRLAIKTFDPSTFTFDAETVTNDIISSVFSINDGIFTGGTYGAVHDLDNDGDLEYFFHYYANWTSTQAIDIPDGTYLEPNSVTAQQLSLNASISGSADFPRSIVFADVNNDGYYSFFYNQYYYQDINGDVFTTAISTQEPGFTVNETSPVANRCKSGGSCTVPLDSVVTYNITAIDPDNDALKYAYDCYQTIAPNPTALINLTVSDTFQCTYDSIGTTNTRIWVTDGNTYENLATITVSITNSEGLLCNNNGVFEPALGETEENCLADFESQSTQEEQVDQATITQVIEEIYQDRSIDRDLPLLDIFIDDDGDVQASGQLEEQKEFIYDLFTRLFTFYPYAIIMVILLGGIAFFTTAKKR